MKLIQASILRAAASTVLFSLLAACAATIEQAPSSRTELLAGTALFGAPVPEGSLPREDVLGVDESMRAFVRKQVQGVKNPEFKLKRLLGGMGENGLFSLDYAGADTRTVKETFHDRKGNCLSFTMLFVVLAREAGLDAGYQMVEIPPVWSSDSDLVVLNNHINAIINLGSAGRYVADFNLVEAKGNYPKRRVSDEYALALYHSNRGVNYLAAHDNLNSFLELRAAIRAYPGIPGPWTNLGVLYSRNGLYAPAESAYLEALRVDSGNLSALNNLASLHQALGDEERAEFYLAKVRSYRERNPYYYYSLASSAYEEQQFDEALTQIDKAIRLKHDEHQFYFLRGLVHSALGERDAARNDFATARNYAEFDDVKRRYEAKIAALAGA